MTILRQLFFCTICLFLTACGGGSNNASEPVFTPAPPPISTPVPPPAEEPTFQQKLDNEITGSTIPGAIAWLSNGEQTWLAASGFADKDNQVQITTDSQMRIASMTKTLVAVTMLKMTEEGLFDIDDTIEQFLPAELNAGIPNTQLITIKHLLAMTSGITDYVDDDGFNDAVELNPQAQWTAESALSFILGDPALFMPGETWGYSNSNYVLCDIIVSNVTGNSLASQMRRILFDPLLMASSYVENQASESANGSVLTAHGYEGNTDVTAINDGIGFGDGGVVSTVSDLSLFLRGVFGDKQVLSEQSLSLMQAFHPTEDYGLGLEKRTHNIGIALAHNGASSGFSGDMMIFPEQNIIWVVLTNQVEDDNFDLFTPLSSVLSTSLGD